VTTVTPTLEIMDDPPLPSDAEAALRARRLISPRTGLINDVMFSELDADDPPLHWAIANPGDAEATGMRWSLNSGNAVAADPSRAVLKAVGECVERYCSAQWDESDFTVAAYRELDADAVHPASFALFGEQQYDEPSFPGLRFTEETTVPWVRGTSLARGEPMLVPAPFVYVPFEPEPDEQPIWMPISTGLACAPSLAQAAYRGILEQIERDTFMIVWRNQLVRPQIDLASIDDPVVRQLVAAYDGMPFACFAIVLTLDIPVTVILGLLVSETGHEPLNVVGLGVDLNPRRAVQLALEELSQGFIGMRRVLAGAPEWRPAEDFSDILNVTLHGHAHAVEPRLWSSTEFLRGGDVLHVDELPDRSGATPKANLATVMRDLDALGMDAIMLDITTEDVDEAGFKVVRAVVPGLQPLDTSHPYQYRGGRRLYDVAVRLGLRDGPLSPVDLNPLPHPFP
jgi:ribosomal protein S12 methylthiotransferase accessory factor